MDRLDRPSLSTLTSRMLLSYPHGTMMDVLMKKFLAFAVLATTTVSTAAASSDAPVDPPQ